MAAAVAEHFADQSEAFLRGVRQQRWIVATSNVPTHHDRAARLSSCSVILRRRGYERHRLRGGRDFTRPISAEVYGIPSERVIGSSVGLVYAPDHRGGAVTRQAASDVRRLIQHDDPDREFDYQTALSRPWIGQPPVGGLWWAS